MTTSTEPSRSRDRADLETWVRRACALMVGGVAAYSSYEHQREFALEGGADVTNAALWPLAVDGLLLSATVGLLKPGHQTRRMRIAEWLAFLGCIAVSLAAKMAAAPRLAWQPILVAGWPPVALLLAVELLAHRSRSRRPTETESTAPEAARRPGPELDRVAGTNNYGRTVLRSGASKAASPPSTAPGARAEVRHDPPPNSPSQMHARRQAATAITPTCRLVVSRPHDAPT
jgi:Protein of unknown function (DUF2637)